MHFPQLATATDEGLEHSPEAGSSANIGIMLVKPTANDLAKVGGRPPSRLTPLPRHSDLHSFLC